MAAHPTEVGRQVLNRPPLVRRSGGDPSWSPRAATGLQRLLALPRPALPAPFGPRVCSGKVQEVRGHVALSWQRSEARGGLGQAN